MKFLKYCQDPLFFIKIYNAISDEKRDEFESKFNEAEKMFNEEYDSHLFNPKISFKDGLIEIKQTNFFTITINAREDLYSTVLVSEDLLEEILHEFNICHGLYVCDKPDDTYSYKLDHNEICECIEKILA